VDVSIYPMKACIDDSKMKTPILNL